MPSLREIVTAHGPTLVLDAASVVVHAGWLESGAPARWAAVEEEAGAGVFRALERLGVAVADARSFVFCEGPGSVLGIRTSAMALRTWQVLQPRPLFAYRSLELLARTRGRPGQTLIVDARKQRWHAITLAATGAMGALRREEPAALPPPLATPAGFRQWTPLPPVPVETLPYDLPALWAEADTFDLLRATAQPDAFQHEEPSYATWTQEVHQAPAPASALPPATRAARGRAAAAARADELPPAPS